MVKKTSRKTSKKKKTHLNPRPFFVLGVILIIFVGGYFILQADEDVQYYEFTKCLAETGATEYGFDACPNCATQKHILGEDAFKQNIEDAGFYVKCRPESEANEPIGDRLNRISILEQYRDQLDESTTQGELCALMVSTGTPTRTTNANQVAGWQTVEELSQLSGCPIHETGGNE